MAYSDKEIITFINQMSPEMKQDAIKGLEFLRRMTIADYKQQQIEAAEALITDIQNNPDNYTTAKLNHQFPDLLGEFEISEDLENRIEIVRHFIGYRTKVIYKTDGSVERHKSATYGEYIKSKNHEEFMAHITDKKRKKKNIR